MLGGVKVGQLDELRVLRWYVRERLTGPRIRRCSSRHYRSSRTALRPPGESQRAVYVDVPIQVHTESTVRTMLTIFRDTTVLKTERVSTRAAHVSDSKRTKNTESLYIAGRDHQHHSENKNIYLKPSSVPFSHKMCSRDGR